MGRNIRGGNKAKRQKNSSGDNSRRALLTKDSSADSSQLYGKVVKRLGGRPAYILILCEDGIERKCVVRGKFNKRVWFNENDYVLITYNQTTSEQSGEIEHKYFPHEVAQLLSKGEIDDGKFKQNDDVDDNDLGIIFAKESDTKKESDYSDLMSNDTSKQRVFVATMGNSDDEDDEWNLDDI
jgi:initiation factor 1A